MAKWWKLDPDIVARWSMPEFSDREEFMMLQITLSDPDYKPEQREWTGRDNG